MPLGDIFISYSRTDKETVGLVARRLDRVYGQIWFDRELVGGQDWWQEILSQIANCDVFVYMISPDSIRSEYCLAEYAEARRLNKPIVPIMVRSYLDLPPEIKQLQIIDMSLGMTEDNLTELYAAINYHLPQVSASKSGGTVRRDTSTKRDTLTMMRQPQNAKAAQKAQSGPPVLPLLLALLVIGGGVALVLLLSSQANNTNTNATATSAAALESDTTQTAQNAESEAATNDAATDVALSDAAETAQPTSPPEETATEEAAPIDEPTAEAGFVDPRPAADAPIHLVYSFDNFVLHNRSGQFQDIGGLSFTRTTSSGQRFNFSSDEWRNNFVNPAALRRGACLQIGHSPAIAQADPDFCSRLGWVAPNARTWFWSATRADEVFTVTRNGVLLAECPAAVEAESANPLECALYLTPPES